MDKTMNPTPSADQTISSPSVAPTAPTEQAMAVVISPTLEKRFLAKVSKTPACWLWTGSRNGNGYGEIYEGPVTDKNIQAHRAAYLIYRGAIPGGMNVLHKCDNPICVNPDHLWLGTHTQNTVDMVQKGRCYNRKTTDAMVRQIRNAVGVSSSAIAQKCGLHPAHVRKIRRGLVAKHVSD